MTGEQRDDYYFKKNLITSASFKSTGNCPPLTRLYNTVIRTFCLLYANVKENTHIPSFIVPKVTGLVSHFLYHVTKK